MFARFRLSTGSLLGVLTLCGVSLYLSNYPLWHTDVWAHAKYGEFYCQHRTSPGTEPLSPYSDQSEPFPDVAWLSQSAYYLLYEAGAAITGGDEASRLAGGAEALRSSHLLLLIARMGLLWLALRRSGGSAAWATLGTLLYFLAVGIGTAIQRPQAFGLFFFTAIVYALSRETLSRRAMIALPICFLLWANLHGTFLAGLLLIALHFVGRLIERGHRDPDVRRVFLVGLLCGLATLINPHGLLLYRDVLAFSGHPNLKSMTEWYPMRLTAAGGMHWPYLMSLVLLAFVRLLGDRKFGWGAVIVCLPFAVWPWFQVRMVTWWWTLAMLHVARLGPGLAKRFPTMPRINEGNPTTRKAIIATAAVAFAIAGFPAWRTMVHRDPDRVLAPQTPWRLAMELNAPADRKGQWMPEIPPDYRGPIFASETQGDYLVWALERESPLIYTHAHIYPVDHWEACRHVKAGNPGWKEFLAGLGVNMLVFEIETHEGLVTAVEADADWRVISRERGVLIAIRIRPIPPM